MSGMYKWGEDKRSVVASEWGLLERQSRLPRLLELLPQALNTVPWDRMLGFWGRVLKLWLANEKKCTI